LTDSIPGNRSEERSENANGVEIQNNMFDHSKVESDHREQKHLLLMHDKKLLPVSLSLKTKTVVRHGHRAQLF
jgi:hypothetical protein